MGDVGYAIQTMLQYLQTLQDKANEAQEKLTGLSNCAKNIEMSSIIHKYPEEEIAYLEASLREAANIISSTEEELEKTMYALFKVKELASIN